VNLVQSGRVRYCSPPLLHHVERTWPNRGSGFARWRRVSRRIREGILEVVVRWLFLGDSAISRTILNRKAPRFTFYNYMRIHVQKQ
jgi:hypothetical protein